MHDPALATAAGQAKLRVEPLDVLRLLAALSVVMFHYSFRGAAADNFTTVYVADWAPVAKYGYLGVDLFFIISGFVIAWSAAGRTALSFGIARAARLYPGFFVCMSLTCLISLSAGGPRFAVSFPQWFANLFIAAPALRQPFMDGAYWSIVYELVFYGWVAILLGLGIFWRKFNMIIVIWLALSLCNEHLVHSNVLERLLLTSKSGLFATGMLIYALRIGRRSFGLQLLLLASVLVAIDQNLLDAEWLRQHYQQQWSSEVVALATFGCALAVLVGSSVHRIPLPSGLVLALGGMTYPLYLLHQHIGYIALNALHGLATPGVLVVSTATVMSALAWMVWRFIERPGIRICKRALTRIVMSGEKFAVGGWAKFATSPQHYR
jgi:peptidoglycan/LPS O-acetylase OafA/YrhL